MKDPIEVTGIMLRGDGDDIVVEAEIGGEWREVIREYAAGGTDTISHIVEPAGIRRAIEEPQTRDEPQRAQETDG